MFQRFSFTIDEPQKMKFRTAEGNTVSELPSRVELADKITRYYGETLSVKNEQNDIDIKVAKGRLVGWEISPQGGTKFTVTTKEAREGKISYLSGDGLTFTLNDISSMLSPNTVLRSSPAIWTTRDIACPSR